MNCYMFFFFQAEDGIRDIGVTGVQTCALPILYGQMTAGSWIYIGTQGILQGTYETFAAVAAKLAGRHDGHGQSGGSLAGTLTLTGGCGGKGGAQPSGAALHGRGGLFVGGGEGRVGRRGGA